jgi:hypothetical protein
MNALRVGCQKCGNIVKKLFVPFFVHALRAIVYGGVSFSIDINALWAIMDCDSPFSIDMNALRAIAAISHREIMSIERIRCMYCYVRRTLTTNSERKYLNIAPIFYTPPYG